MDRIDIDEIFKRSENRIQLERTKDDSISVLNMFGIEEKSVLGRVILHFSAITVNNYIRILGNKNFADFNEMVHRLYPGRKLAVAADIWGGIFALSNGDFEGDARNIWYFAPDTLEWENLEITYLQFLFWVNSENIKDFYASLMWNGMDAMLSELKEDQAVLIYPFLWSKECDIDTAEKKVVPVKELLEMNLELQRKLERVSSHV